MERFGEQALYPRSVWQEDLMPASSDNFSTPSLPVEFREDGEFLQTVAETLERLQFQSEQRGHPLLASLLAITKGEVEDDLRTSTGEFGNGRPLSEADTSTVRMAQRLACIRPEATA
jgi:hypothetical protein